MDSFQSERHQSSRLDSLRTSVGQHLSSRPQHINTDISQAIDKASESFQTASKDFREAVRAFESDLSNQQRTRFRSTTFRDVYNALDRIQREQANKSRAMDLPRAVKFLEGMRIIEKQIQFAEKPDFLAYALGTMKHSLEKTSDFPDVFDTFVKAYKTIGESIMFSDVASIEMSRNPRCHLVMSRISADVLKMLLLVLKILSIPLPVLGQAFASTWHALLPQWEKLSQNLIWYKDLVETQKWASVEADVEQRRLLSLSSQPVETVESRRQWTEIKQWLASDSGMQNHEDICDARRDNPKSGAWLLRHPRYVAWRSDDVPQMPVLWLNGILGAGKTVLASRVIDDCRQDDAICTAFFYCHHDDQQRRSLISIFRAIISQLLTVGHLLLPWCYEQYIGSNQLSLIDDKICRGILMALFLCNNRTFVVLDGLDECEQKDRRLFLNFFEQAMSVCESYDPGKLRLMIVSRDEYDIRKALRTSSEILITPTDNGDDMKRFVGVWCKRIHEKFEELDQCEIDYISESTLDRADGMFLFAKLVVMNLFDQMSLEALQEQILPEKFPVGLDAAYDRILKRISKVLDSHAVAHAKKILGWMTCARRPLKWHEIQGALSVNTTHRMVDFAGRRSRIHIREICGSLVSNLSGDRLELIHISAKDYLDKSSFIERTSAEISLASLCLNYLAFECFEPDLPEEQLEALLLQGSFAFQDYASSHWSDHTLAVITTKSPTTLNMESFTSALTNFVGHYELDSPEVEEIDDAEDDCRQFQDSESYIDIRFVACCIRQQRNKGQQALDEVYPPPLDRAIMSNRAILEKLARLATLTSDVKEKLEQAYGRRWYKCKKAACHYFHEGFVNDEKRDFHVLRHEQPFRCPYAECESGYKMGFASMKQREKHMSVHHPEHTKLKTIFARVRKDKEPNTDTTKNAPSNSKHPARFFCDSCSKSYTRQEKLNNHLRTHQDERSRIPCSTPGCTKSFSREDERKRHEKEVHLGEKKFVCTFELKYGIPGSRVHGCGRGFQRLEALDRHWRSDAGQVCLKPLHDEEQRERQWQEQISKRKAEGLELPLPYALYEQFPHLRRTISEDSSTNATGAVCQSIDGPRHRKWQPFRPSSTSETASSEQNAGPRYASQSSIRQEGDEERTTW